MGPTDKMGENSSDVKVWKQFPPSSFADTAGIAYKRWFGAENGLASAISSEKHANYLKGGISEPTEDYHSILLSSVYEKWFELAEPLGLSQADFDRIEFPFYHDPRPLDFRLQSHLEVAKCFDAKFYPEHNSAACRDSSMGFCQFLKDSNLDLHRLGSVSSDGRGSRVGNSTFFTPEGMDGIAGPNFSDRITDAIKAFEDPTTSVADRLRLWQGMKFMIEHVTYNLSEVVSEHICHTRKHSGPITLKVGKGAAGCAKALKFLSVGCDPEPAAYTFESAMTFFQERKGNTDLIRKIFGQPPVDKKPDKKPGKKPSKKRKVRTPTPPH